MSGWPARLLALAGDDGAARARWRAARAPGATGRGAADRRQAVELANVVLRAASNAWTTRRIHFVGIGGIGMSGIAELLANLGYVVTGSDAKRSEVTARLERLRRHGARGARRVEHRRRGRRGGLVGSQAGEPGGGGSQEPGIPVIPRAEMLAELMRLRFAIAVAGSHGKTTTTSMIALVLERAGLDPTAVIGGRLSAFGSNARLGHGDYMVAEADESDRSFLMLWPSIAVMTNIDHEHMESYGTFADLQQAFADFANKVPFYGGVVACADDPSLAAVLPRLTRKLVTYGLGEPRRRTYVGSGVELGAFGGRCYRRATRRITASSGSAMLELSVPGRHNLQNALAAVAVGEFVGLDFDRIAAALRGIPRRRAALRATRRSGRRDGGRRLRPPSDRDRRGAGRRSRDARPPAGRGVPAASVLADPAAAGRVRPVAQGRR